MIDFETWWNSADSDDFRAKNEERDGNVFSPVWDAAVRAMLASAPTAPSLATDAGAALSHSNEVAIAKQYDIDESLVRDLWREFAAMHSEQRMSDAARVEWQPIETAPKDREIWAFNGEQGRMIWSEGHDWALWIWADPLLSDADPCPEQPTHWREFPTAPIDAARAAEIERSEGKS